ncbi:MAG: hypothetical protein KDI17_02805 [Halioglobus sp.]|nr:hypothetical protein [Halioglobus sp.]
MNNLLFIAAALLGAIAIGWMGNDFAGANTLAFAVTAAIGAVYLIGIVELLRFRRATASLEQALAGVTPQVTADELGLEHWLRQLDPALRGSVHLRIVGERSALPPPMFTPYLVGLLVMLGLLGTFVGMVDTLSGAVSALQGSTELDAIRASLTAPMQGLGIAFGTSVAGVAASAMLGLMSTLVRHQRVRVTRQLDTAIADTFKVFSLAHQRQQAYDALQSQAGVLPTVAIELQGVAAQLAQLGDRLASSLLANQQQFHASAEQRFGELATSVDRSLRESLAASGKAAGDSMQPVLTGAVAEISNMLRETQQQQAQAATEQLRALGAELGSTSTSLLDGFAATSASWTEQTLALQGDIRQTLTASIREVADTTRNSSTAMLTEIAGLLQSTEALVQARAESETTLLDNQNERMSTLTATVTAQLGELRAQEERGQAAAQARLSELEATVAQHLTALGAGLEGPMTRLIETASETPRAAAEVISQLRTEISNNVERDNQLLEERRSVMVDLNALSESLREATSGQRSAVTDLIASSATLLQDTAAEQRSAVENIIVNATELLQAVTTDQRTAMENLVSASSTLLQKAAAEQHSAVDNLVTSSTVLLQDMTSEQRSAMENLVATSTTLLEETTSRIGDHLLAEAGRISEASTHVAAGAIELGSLGEAFSVAVQQFNSANEAMIEQLARVEASMERSSNRSEEQMAYYVAQAREIIDYSMLSQKEIMDDLRRINRSTQKIASEAK